MRCPLLVSLLLAGLCACHGSGHGPGSGAGGGGDVAVDGDGDGFDVQHDCDDAAPAIHPGAVEVPGDDVDEDCDGVAAPCAAGAWRCQDGAARRCGVDGRWGTPAACPALCSETLGCIACAPGAGTCDGDTAHLCRADGSGWDDTACDPVQGSACSAGHCTGPCAREALGESAVGCDHYAAVTINADGLQTVSDNHFAVAVANATSSAATVTITRDAAVVASGEVAAGGARVFTLPWDELLTARASARGLAYRVRSTQPVAVVQLNTYEPASYTADASRLYPVNAWGTDYRTASYTPLSGYPSLAAVVAAEDGTEVTFTPSATATGVLAGGGLEADGAGTVTLDAGEVLQVLAAPGADLTGTRITSTRPVEVIGGQSCADVPVSTSACDHLEEAVPPTATLGRRYVVVAPLRSRLPASPAPVRVRVVATEADTAFDPPLAGLPAALAAPGDFAEVEVADAREIAATRPVLVALYMEGGSLMGGLGDPSLTLAVPVERFRARHVVLAPPSFGESYVTVVGPVGAAVTIDGVPAAALTPVGAGGYGYVRAPLAATERGLHTVVADPPVSVDVYGLTDYVSYWYPGAPGAAAP